MHLKRQHPNGLRLTFQRLDDRIAAVDHRCRRREHPIDALDRPKIDCDKKRERPACHPAGKSSLREREPEGEHKKNEAQASPRSDHHGGVVRLNLIDEALVGKRLSDATERADRCQQRDNNTGDSPSHQVFPRNPKTQKPLRPRARKQRNRQRPDEEDRCWRPEILCAGNDCVRDAIERCRTAEGP